MSRRIKIIESERSPSVVSSIWKQRVILERNIRVLDTSQRMVVNRITLNQKIAFKVFKKKLHQAKLSHARILGDREAEKLLRNRSDHMFSHMNTNLGNDPEDEDVLKKIWNRGNAMRERQLMNDRKSTPTFRTVRTIKSAPASRLVSRARTETDPPSPRAELAVPRPQTVATVHPQLPLSIKSQPGIYISTGQAGQPAQSGKVVGRTVPKIEITDATEAETQKLSRKQRPRTTGSNIVKTDSILAQLPRYDDVTVKKSAQFLATVINDNDDNDDDCYSDGDGSVIALNKRSSPRLIPSLVKDVCQAGDTMTTTIFDDDNRQARLLELQRERVKSANYEEKVKLLCQKMSPYKASKDYVINDYYQTCMAKDSRALRGKKTFVCQPSINQEAELRRAMGNLSVKNMTLKSLDYDFNNYDSRTENMGVA